MNRDVHTSSRISISANERDDHIFLKRCLLDHLERDPLHHTGPFFDIVGPKCLIQQRLRMVGLARLRMLKLHFEQLLVDFAAEHFLEVGEKQLLVLLFDKRERA